MVRLIIELLGATPRRPLGMLSLSHTQRRRPWGDGSVGTSNALVSPHAPAAKDMNRTHNKQKGVLKRAYLQHRADSAQRLDPSRPPRRRRRRAAVGAFAWQMPRSARDDAISARDDARSARDDARSAHDDAGDDGEPHAHHLMREVIRGHQRSSDEPHAHHRPAA
jgi:hypothetical protein